jgi:hypothetical protein
MAPVQRNQARPAAPSRRAAAPPVQQRRTAAAQPAPRQAVEEDTTPFDATDDSNGQSEEMDDEELPQIVDLSAVEAATYEVIPRGIYEGYVDSIEYGLSQSKGLPMLTWVLKFDYDGKERTLRYYTTLAGDGAGRTKATLSRLDPDLDLSQLVPDEMDEHFSGAEVRIRVTIRPDRDDRKVKRNNVADIMPIDEEFAE